MHLLTASNNGLVKLYDLKDKRISCAWGKQERDREITSMAWGNSDESEVLTGNINGQIQAWKLDGKLVANYNLDNSIIGLESLDQNYFTCDCAGGVAIVNSQTKEITKFAMKRPVTKVLFSKELVGGCTQQKDRERVSEKGRFLLLGPENKLAQVFDLETEKVTWNAKNVPKDFLDLAVPIHDLDATWIDPAHTFVVVTAHHQIRTYDIRAQCRPVTTTDHKKTPFTSVKINPRNKTTIAAGDAIGNLRLHDMRKSDAGVAKFLGMSGSVRSISFHPTEPLLAAVGLDRFLHVWDSRNKKSQVKVYMKQRLNHVLFSSFVPPEVKAEPKDDDVIDSMDEDEPDSFTDSENSISGSFDDEEESSEEVVVRPTKRLKTGPKK